MKHILIIGLALSFTGCGGIHKKSYKKGFNDGIRFMETNLKQAREEYETTLNFYKQLSEVEQSGNEAQKEHWRRSANEFEKMIGDENELEF